MKKKPPYRRFFFALNPASAGENYTVSSDLTLMAISNERSRAW